MADRAANVASIGVSAVGSGGAAYTIKVIQWNLDTEIRYSRSETSDYDCVLLSVFETAGGIIRATGYVDPADAVTALILASFAGVVGAADFDFASGKLILDKVADSAGSRRGYTLGDCKLFPMNIGGMTDEAGMIEMQFEIHPKGQTSGALNFLMDWSTTLT